MKSDILYIVVILVIIAVCVGLIIYAKFLDIKQDCMHRFQDRRGCDDMSCKKCPYKKMCKMEKLIDLLFD